MAEPKMKEASPNPVGHAEIADTLTTPILEYNLLKEIENLHKEDAWLKATGPSSKTLVKHADMRVVLIAMRKNVVMREHTTSARISVQTLAGHVRLKLADRSIDLPAGHLLALDPNVTHDVAADEDSAFLLTLSWRSQNSEAGEPDGQK